MFWRLVLLKMSLEMRILIYTNMFSLGTFGLNLWLSRVDVPQFQQFLKSYPASLNESFNTVWCINNDTKNRNCVRYRWHSFSFSANCWHTSSNLTSSVFCEILTWKKFMPWSWSCQLVWTGITDKICLKLTSIVLSTEITLCTFYQQSE